MQSKLSHSALGTFRTCPQKFKFSYIDKASVPKRLFAYNHLGNAVHRQLKIAYQWSAEGRQYPLDTMLAAFESDWGGKVREKVVPSSEGSTVDDEILTGRILLQNYYTKFHPFDQGVMLLAERKLDFELANCPVGFTTKIDRLSKIGDGLAEICDYKTSKSFPAGPKDDSFRLQMAMYQLAVQESFPQFETVELTQYFLRHQEEVRCRMRADELDELAEQFRTEAHEIARAERLDSWPTKEGNHCKRCDYAHLCPAKRHERVMEETEEGDAPGPYREAATLADEYLSCDSEIKRLEKGLAVLREELVVASRDLSVSKFRGATGQVIVTLKPVEKLPTKTKDPGKYVEMVSLVRSWDEDTREICLKPDETILMGLYQKGRLTPQQKESLGGLIQRSEQVRVAGKLDQPVALDELENGEPDL